MVTVGISTIDHAKKNNRNKMKVSSTFKQMAVREIAARVHFVVGHIAADFLHGITQFLGGNEPITIRVVLEIYSMNTSEDKLIKREANVTFLNAARRIASSRAFFGAARMTARNSSKSSEALPAQEQIKMRALQHEKFANHLCPRF